MFMIYSERTCSIQFDILDLSDYIYRLFAQRASLGPTFGKSIELLFFTEHMPYVFFFLNFPI